MNSVHFLLVSSNSLALSGALAIASSLSLVSLLRSKSLHGVFVERSQQMQRPLATSGMRSQVSGVARMSGSTPYRAPFLPRTSHTVETIFPKLFPLSAEISNRTSR